MMFQSPSWWIVWGLADTVLHAWSHLQLCNLVEVLWTGFCFALADAAKDSPAPPHAGKLRIPNRRWDWQIVVCIMILTSCVTSVHLSGECTFLWGFLPITVLWSESLDLDWCCQIDNPNRHDVSAFVYLSYDSFVIFDNVFSRSHAE